MFPLFHFKLSLILYNNKKLLVISIKEGLNLIWGIAFII